MNPDTEKDEYAEFVEKHRDDIRNLYLLMLKRNIRTLSERQAAITKDNGKRG